MGLLSVYQNGGGSKPFPLILAIAASTLILRSWRKRRRKEFINDAGQHMPQQGLWQFFVGHIWKRSFAPLSSEWVLECSRQLGDIWRHPAGIVITNPEFAKQLLTSHWPKAQPSGPWNQAILRPLGMHGMSPQQHPPISPALHQNSLGRQYSESFHYATSMLVHRWAALCAKDPAEAAVIHIDEWMNRFALDAIGSVALGRTFETVTQKEDGITSFLTALGEWMSLAADPVLQALPSFCKFPFASLRQRRAALTMLDQWLLKLLEEKRLRRGSIEKPDLMDLVLSQEKEDAEIADKTWSQQVLVLLLAGRDAVAGTLTAALQLLAQHPEAQQRARQELRVAMERGGHSGLTFELLGQLAYLSAVLKETLRLFPRAMGCMGRVCPSDGEVVGGYHIPKGTLVEVSLHGVHRHPDHWSQPDEFRPERFLVTEANDGTNVAWMPFGVGQRECAGIGFAWTEMLMALAALLQNFSWAMDTVSENGVSLAMQRLHVASPSLIVESASMACCPETDAHAPWAPAQSLQVDWEGALMVHGPLVIAWSFLGSKLDARVVCTHWRHGCATARLATQEGKDGCRRRPHTVYSVRTREGVMKSTPRSGRASKISMWLSIVGLLAGFLDIFRNGSPVMSFTHIVGLYASILVLSSYCAMRLSKEGILQRLERKHWMFNGTAHWVVMIVVISMLLLANLVLPASHGLVILCPAGRLIPIVLFILGCFLSSVIATYDFHQFVEDKMGAPMKVSTIRLPISEDLACPVCYPKTTHAISDAVQ